MTVADRNVTGVRHEPIDAAMWPDLATVPHSPVRTAVAQRIFRRAAARLPLRVAEPRRTYGGGTAGDPVMRLVRPDSFFARLGASRDATVTVVLRPAG